VGGGGGARAADRWAPLPWIFFFLFYENCSAESLGLAHGRAAFAGPVVPGALCRELPLGTGCAESNQACAERITLSAHARIPVVERDPKRTSECGMQRRGMQDKERHVSAILRCKTKSMDYTTTTENKTKATFRT
jgi:hypothetical protein